MTQNNSCRSFFFVVISVSSLGDNHFASIWLVDLVAFNMAMKIERTSLLMHAVFLNFKKFYKNYIALYPGLL